MRNVNAHAQPVRKENLMDHLNYATASTRHRLLQPKRLLHIDASGSEVAIDYTQVRHLGSYADLKRVMEGFKVMENVGIFREKVIPVIDIRSGSTAQGADQDDAPYRDFIVLSLQGRLVGVRVDRVIDILLTPTLDIDSSTAWRGREADFIVGMVNLQKRRLPLVDMQRLLIPAALPASADSARI
jgi:chemotaxis signal transduction protein